MNHNQIIREYQYLLQQHVHIYFSPGRVNLIGEHIDYVGGTVFPLAINLGTYAYVEKRTDRKCAVISHNMKDQGVITFDLDHLQYKKEDGWANFVKGMIHYIMKQGYKITHGFNIVIYGDLPHGAGLSSSASLEMLVAVIMNEEFKFEIARLELIQWAKHVENNYIGVNCGIMDQFAVGMGKKDYGMILNTDTLDYEYVPIQFDGFTFVISNTNKSRQLTDSKYNERRSEIKEIKNALQGVGLATKELCEYKPSDLMRLQEFIKNPLLQKRLRHVVTEQARTMKAKEMLQQNKLNEFGQLMNESHFSLQDDYEVSCKELDILARAFNGSGALGSRMTGAGFGGCTISLVPTDKLDDILKHVTSIYNETTTYEVDHYIVTSSDGTQRLKEE